VVHELELKAPSQSLIRAVDYELVAVIKLGVFSSVFDHLPLETLVGKLDIDIRIHCREFASLVLDVSFKQLDL